MKSEPLRTTVVQDFLPSHQYPYVPQPEADTNHQSPSPYLFDLSRPFPQRFLFDSSFPQK